MVKQELLAAMEDAVTALRQYKSRTLSLYCHNDTDGICSGSILLNSFNKCAYDVSITSLEKPYPQVLEQIFSRNQEIIVFADFAGKIAPLIAKMNQGRNLVIIIDHHPAEESKDPLVFNLDGDLYGLQGDRDISASATSFLFAEVLLRQYKKSPCPLAHLGALGAIGDGFLVDGCLSSVNREILKSAILKGLMRKVKNSEGEEYFITLQGIEYTALKICEILDTLGGVGYYEEGTVQAIDLCLNGFSDSITSKISVLRQRKEELFSRELKKLKKEIGSTEHLQWFNVEDRFASMGVKMIGVFCMLLKDMAFIDQTKYLAGFQDVPDFIPGFGDVSFNSSKISMRVSRYLTKKIQSGEIPALSSFLPDASYALGGFVDACHGLSAATTIEKGKEKDLIDQIENEIKKRMK